MVTFLLGGTFGAQANDFFSRTTNLLSGTVCRRYTTTSQKERAKITRQIVSQITHRGSKVSDFRAFGAVVTEFPSVSSPRSLAETCLSLSRSSPRQYKHANLIVLFVKLCNVLEWQDKKIIYRKYASLYFIAGVSGYENELSILEALHHFVESLDKYFGNVCELDLIYNFHKVSS